MSNVLIGIIGVILFIGLALAGALFLGPRFQQSTSQSKAAAAIQSLQQIQNSIDMYQSNEQITYDYAYYPSNLVNGGYLKAVPVLADGTAAVMRTVTVGASNPLFATFKLQTASNGQVTCQAINQQYLGTSAIETTPTEDKGCYYNGASYLAYAKVLN